MPPPRTSFKPLELAPEWLTESPITFDDLRCTTYPPTLWRVSLPPSPAAPRSRSSKVQHRRDSVASASSSSSSSSSSSADIVELSKAGSPQRCQDHPRVVSTHLAPEDASSFLFYHDDENDEDERDGLHIGRWAPEREHEDDEATLNDQGPGPEILAVEEEDPSPIDPFFKPKSQPHSVAPSPALLSLPLPAPAPSPSPSPAPESEQEYAHSHGSSFDCASPWFMHVSAGALAALDDQLLQAPVDAFADLCYARAVQLPCASSSSDAGAVEAVPYSWRRFSRLRPLSPFSDIHEAEEEERGQELEEEEESTDGSDTDGDDEVVSPDGDWPGQGAMTRPRIYSPTPHAHRDAHPPAHPRHYAHESDGSIQFRSQAQTLSMSPTALASTTIPTTASKPLPLTPQPSPSPSPPPDAFYDLGELRGAAASPPPLFLPSPAVSQAQLALLFGAQTPPKPSESVHFFPGSGAPVSGNGSGKGWSRRGVQALRISTNSNANGISIGGGGSGGSTPATATATNTHAGGGGGWFQRGLRAIRA